MLSGTASSESGVEKKFFALSALPQTQKIAVSFLTKRR